MTYDIYRYIFIGAAVLCGIMFVVSVFIFIFLKIPKIISDLTGATARKAIKSIREQNETTGDKGYKASAVNRARGKLTDKISQSGNVIQKNQSQMYGIDTTKIASQVSYEGEQDNQTTVLEYCNDTTLIDGSDLVETSVLQDQQLVGETTVLCNSDSFALEYEITFIHTNEIIEAEANV